MVCASCGTENRAGRKFCAECGLPLLAACAACGAANEPGERFCGECGAPLGEQSTTAPAAQPVRRGPEPRPAAERRVVSIIFCDLVGFTSLAEGRDPEEVRELLSRYFDTARRLVDLYGGVVEKFIGDAVMAVWGAPTATEDDAERAVRVALDLVTAVGALGEETGVELHARAGVLTGEAAVTLGATGQGMVAGDLVNTASRVQSVAEPGTVLVGEATRRASEQTIVYEPAGRFQLKGKEDEVELWRALRVVSGRGGSLKSTGLEAPFVGRERELRQIKELFHASAEEGRAQLVSLTGIAGIGKSRLAWEFYKYFDGIEQLVYWHRGRCLAYGEGVTYWALADMVRMRCGVAEDDAPDAALAKLRAALEEHVLDPDERRFVEPRLAQLLGLAEPDQQRERQDLFAAWRLFFERLSDSYPTVLAFEDMQWADGSLLDFVEYLLEWSRDHAIYVITLARPELAERRPTWGAGQRNFASLYLEPLPPKEMTELLAGLVPGLPPALRERILERAEGVPLYAVETVRMLLDRGLLAEDGSSYRVVGELESLDVPETLQALAAARLDGLTADERRVVQDASVLGKTFTLDALAAVHGSDAADPEPLLAGLVRKELFGLQTDPRSPEHGQYGFLQDLLRQVAYDTLSRHDRSTRHLAAADHLGSALSQEESAEVVAAHLLQAYRLDADGGGAAELRKRARAAFDTAGHRAAALGASSEAMRLFAQAAELTDNPGERAAALLRAGEAALTAGDPGAAPLLEGAQALYEQAGERHGAARAAGARAYVDLAAGRGEEGIARLEAALATIEADEPGATHAELLSRLASANAFAGRHEHVAEYAERALDLAEALGVPDARVRGWQARAMAIRYGRPVEARGLHRLILEEALEHGLTRYASVAYGNLSDDCLARDRYGEALAYLEQGLGIARQTGDRRNEWFAFAEQSYALTMLGRWDEALARAAEIPEERLGRDIALASVLTGVLEVHIRRGDLEEGRRLLTLHEELSRGVDTQSRDAYAGATAAVRLAEGRAREALAAAEEAIAAGGELSVGSQDAKQGFRHGLEAALELGDPAAAERLLRLIDETPPGLRPPYLAALARRYRARLAGADPSADRQYAAAVADFESLALPFEHALATLDYGTWLLDRGRPGEAEPLLAAATGTFERLGATPWLERVPSVELDPVTAPA